MRNKTKSWDRQHISLKDLNEVDLENLRNALDDALGADEELSYWIVAWRNEFEHRIELQREIALKDESIKTMEKVITTNGGKGWPDDDR